MIVIMQVMIESVIDYAYTATDMIFYVNSCGKSYEFHSYKIV